ncbi:MAG: hypothetical protein HPY57_12905 [Ignavibacteria bacterium]|nr:hypothetical protein [Ignavibacteria bacterium]
MTNLEMLAYFQENIRNLDLDIGIDIPTHEISSCLTLAESLFVEKYYSKFESDEKSRKALSSLVVTTILTSYTPTLLYKNGTQWLLPNNLKYLLSESAFINIDPDGDVTNIFREVPVKPIKLDYYISNIYNPFRIPFYNLVWRLDVSNNSTNLYHILVLPDKATISKYKIMYLSKPLGIDVELNPNGVSLINSEFHKEIVDISIKIFLVRNNLNKDIKINSLDIGNKYQSQADNQSNNQNV